MTWRDSSDRSLADYPHPSLAVDVALLTVRDGRLSVLLHERADGTRALPGVFVHVEETLAGAALRALRDKAGVTGREPVQLRVFDDPERDDRGRVISVAHVDLVPIEGLGSSQVPAPIEDTASGLAFDHAEIVTHAVEWARGLYAAAPDPRHLAGDTFTLLELQRVHEAVAGEPLQKDTFRRRMIDSLEDTGQHTSGGVGKPARLYRRRLSPTRTATSSAPPASTRSAVAAEDPPSRRPGRTRSAPPRRLGTPAP
jgi:8-oxo-dGTP diphosphatase